MEEMDKALPDNEDNNETTSDVDMDQANKDIKEDAMENCDQSSSISENVNKTMK